MGKTVAFSPYHWAGLGKIHHHPEHAHHQPYLGQTENKPHKLTLTKVLKATLLHFE